MKQIVFHPSFEMAGKLARVLERAGPAMESAGLAEDDLGIVIGRYMPGEDEAEIAAHNGGQPFYPASVTKLGWGLAALERLEAGTLEDHSELRRSLRDMLGTSSNAATNYVIDCLTGMTGDTLLEGDELRAAIEAHQEMTRRLASLNWPEWEHCQIVQKASDEDRYGRHGQFLEALGHNVLTPMGAARLIHESVFANSFSASVVKEMRALVKRPTAPEHIAAEPISQMRAFAGGGIAQYLPETSHIFSKAGWCVETGDPRSAWKRHDALIALLPDNSALLCVIFVQGVNAVKDETLLPALGEMVANAILLVNGGDA
ncbi:hypothetical protein ACKTEK_05375 [Tepidamorphus sp. 3E244]|uniref:hypothetical protein n=1 Tax=Tepidamorphus sp. 3E244 TaxID=3385498 RepID=UPI0038FCD3E0